MKNQRPQQEYIIDQMKPTQTRKKITRGRKKDTALSSQCRKMQFLVEDEINQYNI